MQRRLHELIRIRNAVCQTNNAFPLMKGDERQKISEEVNACAACPTFDEVRANICAFSYPFQSFEQQIKSTEKENSVDVSSFAVPSAEAVDDDDWMNVTDQQFESLMAEAIGQNNFNPDDFIESSMRPDAEEVKQVESMLKSFEFFLGQSSGFEGVDSSAERGKKPSKPTMPRKGNQTTSENEKNNGLDDVNIDPDKFLNILNGTFHDLRGDDGFFSDEEDEESSDDNLSAGEIRKEFFEPVGSDDIGVSEIMDLMDKELKGTKVEHNGESYIDYNRNEEDGSNDHDDKSLDPIDIDVNVLSSLLDSLDMEAGGAGPVSNMLREMGVDVPDLPQARRALVEVLDEVDESQ
uniref:Uncharacterized protein n=1 Tax=Leptocylindrus danicus TaxID=163516 RepID=A0A7S2KKB0_9STRA|mmetsp:Transcript_2324/g.3412  ORF Transcript_2324/g.3412 Transcript_2324/m.3412 type:complete len:350 (+) Transcript_2324:1-1050(+)